MSRSVVYKLIEASPILHRPPKFVDYRNVLCNISWEVIPNLMQIGGMTCSSCSNAIEQTLGAEPGIVQLSVALLSGRAEVRGHLHFAISILSIGKPGCLSTMCGRTSASVQRSFKAELCG